jgi:hypothetical protein
LSTTAKKKIGQNPVIRRSVETCFDRICQLASSTLWIKEGSTNLGTKKRPGL